jgi:AraC-like DNA-binding protein
MTAIAPTQLDTLHAELRERVMRAAPNDGVVRPLPGLQMRRASRAGELNHGATSPSFCVTAQGAKVIYLGETGHRYDPQHYMIVTDELPISSRIVEASPDQPYLNAVLRLDPATVGSVLVEAGQFAPIGAPAEKALNVSPLSVELLDAMLRLVRLVDTPAEARYLAPLITREIIYRLLQSTQATRLCQLAAIGGRTNRIAGAIERLRTEFDRAIRVDDLARDLGMSTSAFHQHFKAVTAMTPLQFQKQLRLQEARRLMLGEDLDAASAGYRVGYDDPSHFNREYKRLFGAPPMRDIERLRHTATELADV